jgi:polyisoprenoid-binding protein YceI
MTTTAPVTLAAGQWTVDVEHSTATFRVGNLGRTATGTVPVIDGTIEVGPDGLPSAISGSLDLGAIDTGHARRDKDLRKPRLLDLDRHPVGTFAADNVSASPAGWSVTGYLSARGTRTRLTGDVEVSARGPGRHPDRAHPARPPCPRPPGTGTHNRPSGRHHRHCHYPPHGRPGSRLARQPRRNCMQFSVTQALEHGRQTAYSLAIEAIGARRQRWTESA